MSGCRPEWSNMEQQVDDMTLIRNYLDGAAGAFDVLYDRYRLPLYAYLNRLLPGQTAQVDDIFQQTWIRAIDRLSTYRHEEKFSAWLMRIGHNFAIDFFRTSKRRGESSMDDGLETALSDSTDVSPWRELDSQELGEAIEQAVSELSPELREVFLLRREDVPFREIARIQSCSINTCLGRMQYALKQLRKSLNRWMTEGKEV